MDWNHSLMLVYYYIPYFEGSGEGLEGSERKRPRADSSCVTAVGSEKNLCLQRLVMIV